MLFTTYFYFLCILHCILPCTLLSFASILQTYLYIDIFCILLYILLFVFLKLIQMPIFISVFSHSMFYKQSWPLAYHVSSLQIFFFSESKLPFFFTKISSFHSIISLTLNYVPKYISFKSKQSLHYQSSRTFVSFLHIILVEI